MKRIATVFLLFFAFIAASSQAQVTRTNHTTAIQTGSAKTTFAGQSAIKKDFAPPSGNFETFSTRVDTVGYFGDTTGGNWWIYTPILNQASGDSLDFFGVNAAGTVYTQNADTIGPLEFKYVNSLNVTIDTTPFDTMYYRVMALRVSPPKNITANSIRLVGASLTFLPFAFNSTDSIEFWVVPINDVPFLDGTTHPIPDLFGTAIAKGRIPFDSIVLGQINTVYVPFGNKALTTLSSKNQIGICFFIDGPNFQTDTVGYMLDQNLQSSLGTLTIDTDGSAQVTGEPMRTYKLSLDAGHLKVGGTPNYIGGGGGFFVNFSQLDATGQPTGQAFDGNLVLNTYFSGTASAVDPSSIPGYSLDGNYPNPISSVSDISYSIGQAGPVSITVYNQLGEKMGTVVSAMMGAGAHTAQFNVGTLPDGMYYYKLQSGEFSATHTLVIAR